MRERRRSGALGRPPGEFEVKVVGDLTGRGVWTLTDKDGGTHVRFDWRVYADRPLLRTLTPVLRPAFRWNHAWAAQHGIEDASLEALAHNDAMRAAVQEGVDAANAKLARVEQIKKFTIVEGDWLPGGDELTPTMKLKRKPIDRKYAEAIEAMYAR